MPQYGEVRVDFITYTTGVAPNEANVTVPVSGLINAPTFSGDIIIEGSGVIEGDLTVSGNINLDTITATGEAQLESVFVSGNTFISGDLGVSGETNLNTINATGLAQIGGDLYVGGNSFLSGEVNIGDNTVVSGILTVTGNANVGGNLAVTGNISGDADGGVYGSGYWKVPSGTTDQRPTPALAGMIRWNETINTYEGHDGTQWGSLGGGATGSGTDRVFVLNEQTVNTSYTLPENMNATSCGPITIVDTVEVVIGDGENWSIV